MYSGFRNAKMLSGSPDGCAGFDNVHSQFAGSLLNRVCHIFPSDAVCYHEKPMMAISQICLLDSAAIPL